MQMGNKNLFFNFANTEHEKEICSCCSMLDSFESATLSQQPNVGYLCLGQIAPSPDIINQNGCFSCRGVEGVDCRLYRRNQFWSFSKKFAIHTYSGLFWRQVLHCPMNNHNVPQWGGRSNIIGFIPMKSRHHRELLTISILIWNRSLGCIAYQRCKNVSDAVNWRCQWCWCWCWCPLSLSTIFNQPTRTQTLLLWNCHLLIHHHSFLMLSFGMSMPFSTTTMHLLQCHQCWAINQPLPIFYKVVAFAGLISCSPLSPVCFYLHLFDRVTWLSGAMLSVALGNQATTAYPLQSCCLCRLDQLFTSFSNVQTVGPSRKPWMEGILYLHLFDYHQADCDGGSRLK